MTETAIERLTRKAFQASQEGRWDVVARCYTERQTIGHLKSLSPGLAQKLIELDKWVISRIHEVQAAIQHDLNSLQHQRRQLDHLKQQWIGKQAVTGRHLKTA